MGMFPVESSAHVVFRTVKSFDGQTLLLNASLGANSASCSQAGAAASTRAAQRSADGLIVYEIGAFLGGGASGVVYEALHPQSQMVRLL